MFKQTLLIVTALLFTACAVKQFSKTQSRIIVLKTPAMQFADQGFIRSNETELEVEIFSAGQAVLRLSINEYICKDVGCMRASEFNTKYLSRFYPETLLKNIFLGRPIFEKKNLRAEEGGFSQKLQKANAYNISYSVTPKSIRFKDRLNGVLIKIRSNQ